MIRIRLLPPAILMLATMALGGCREALEPGPVPSRVAGADQYLAELQVLPTTDADLWLVRATITGGAKATRVAGFRARLVLPPTVHVHGDVTDQQRAAGDMMRVVRVDGSDVLAAGASADGLPIGDLFVATLRGPTASLATLRLEVDELVDVTGVDRRSRLHTAIRVHDARVRR